MVSHSVEKTRHINEKTRHSVFMLIGYLYLKGNKKDTARSLAPSGKFTD